MVTFDTIKSHQAFVEMAGAVKLQRVFICFKLKDTGKNREQLAFSEQVGAGSVGAQTCQGRKVRQRQDWERSTGPLETPCHLYQPYNGV
jgi:hypothetical protein